MSLRYSRESEKKGEENEGGGRAMTMCDLRCDVISAKTHHQHPVQLVFFLDVMLRHHSTVSPIYISLYIACTIDILLLMYTAVFSRPLLLFFILTNCY